MNIKKYNIFKVFIRVFQNSNLKPVEHAVGLLFFYFTYSFIIGPIRNVAIFHINALTRKRSVVTIGFNCKNMFDLVKLTISK